ncbi:hypothetical protein B1812_20555 [Methylocystis bryophila]|uniref:Uncharacterized protein n=1 Tax=Methylocystis bryophila TaxID=655015 RepID=A0A1W6MZR1_9HYPH|nr:hypothetical protein B1812_20555 [Methylocystis bryophila]
MIFSRVRRRGRGKASPRSGPDVLAVRQTARRHRNNRPRRIWRPAREAHCREPPAANFVASLLTRRRLRLNRLASRLSVKILLRADEAARPPVEGRRNKENHQRPQPILRDAPIEQRPKAGCALRPIGRKLTLTIVRVYTLGRAAFGPAS